MNPKEKFRVFEKYLLATDVIEDDFSLHFYIMLQPFHVKSNSSSIKHKAFVYSEIIDLLNEDCI